MPGGTDACHRVTPGLLSCVSLTFQNLQARLGGWQPDHSPWGGAETSCSFGEAVTCPRAAISVPLKATGAWLA